MADFPSNYHSGSGKTFIGKRKSLHRWPLAEFAPAAPRDLLKIRLSTTSYAPNHVVTIRSAMDGWTADTAGTYHDGGWDFFLERPRLPSSLVFKFVLDGEHWMDGSNLEIPTNLDAHFDETEVRFLSFIPRFHHGYDNFRLEQTKLAQDAVPRNTREDILYDVIVIGSGVGGGILADSLSDAGVNTLVLEAGGLTLPTHITNLPGDWTRLPDHHKVGHYINQPGSGFLSGVHMSLGGRSVYWSGIIPRMHDWELALWPEEIQAFFRDGGYEPAETLMRKRKTLGPFQDRVVEKLAGDLADWHVEDIPRSRHQPAIDEDGKLTDVLQSSTGLFSTAELLLASQSYHGTTPRDHLTINLGHLVTHIEAEGSRATSVFCQDLIANVTRRYRGKVIVLAAGSLESPRIALNSGLRDFNQKIGRGLTDHPAFFSRSYLIGDENPFGGPQRHAKVFMYKRDATFDDHPFNVEVLINPEFWHLRHADDDLASSPRQSHIEMKFIFASRLDEENYVHSGGIGRKLAVKVNPNGAGLPYFDGARRARNAVLNSLGIDHDPEEGMRYGDEGTVHHAGGTMRVSSDDSGVVDTDLKFEAYDNLYCADPSIWPMIPAANPALTLAALVLRLSSHLQRRI